MFKVNCSYYILYADNAATANHLLKQKNAQGIEAKDAQGIEATSFLNNRVELAKMFYAKGLDQNDL